MTDLIYAAAYPIYRDRGWAPIKLHAGIKFPPPPGFTGRDGIDPSGADCHAWAEEEPNGNLAIRLPADVIGIDVDAYAGKTGAQTLGEAEKRWGRLPYSPRSTSRDDGVSGIRLYRIPAGVELVGVIEFPELRIGDIEVCQHHHRYIMGWPSIHPSGRQYRWLGIDDGPLDGPPAPADIPDLPAAWLEHLRKPERNNAELGGSYDVRQALTEGEPSRRVTAKLQEAILACHGTSRHDNTRDHVLALLRYGKQGHAGVLPALKTLQKAFAAAVGPDRPGGHTQAAEEFRDFVNGERVAQLLAEPNHRDESPPAAEPPDEPPAETDQDPGWTFIDGATFILDTPTAIPTLWGHGNDVLWAEDESLMIAGPMGLGKTTLAIQLMHAQLGLGSGLVLGLPVPERPGKILYLAMDRPAQIARAAHRLFTEAERQVLAERLLIWRGPPPADIAKYPGLLSALAEKADAHTVCLDSIKDAALGLSEDEVGAGYNRARQQLLASGRQLAEQHHTVKRGAGGRAPTGVADIYGSAWIANGTGSIILLSGEPGDPIVGFRHVRAPADEVGPWRLLHNQRAGLLTVEHFVNLVEVADAAGGKLTAKEAATAVFESDEPSKAQIEKARRRLNDLVPMGVFTRVDGTKGGGKKTPAVWLRPGVDPAPFTEPSLFDGPADG